MRKSALALFLAAASACTVAAACSTSSGGGGSPTTVSDVHDAVIGFAQREVDAPYYTAMTTQAKAIAAQQGFKLLVQSANSDPTTQIDQINTMVSQGADLIVVNAVSPQTEKAQLLDVAKKVPLMFIDTGIDGVGFTAVSSNNVAIGMDSGKLAAQRIGSGKTIQAAILNGGPTDEVVGPDRQKGLLAGLKAGGVTVKIVAAESGAYSQDKAVPAAEDMLAAHSNIQAFLTLNDSMGLGALQVLNRQHRTNVLVIAAADGQKQALALIRNCDSQYVSTGLNSPSLATTKVFQIATSVVTGKTAPDSYPAQSYTKAAGIDCHNVNQFYNAKSVF